MGIKVGDKELDKAYFGNSEVYKIYLNGKCLYADLPEYSLTITKNNSQYLGSCSVIRSSSEKPGASIGSLSSGAVIYQNDILNTVITNKSPTHTYSPAFQNIAYETVTTKITFGLQKVIGKITLIDNITGDFEYGIGENPDMWHRIHLDNQKLSFYWKDGQEYSVREVVTNQQITETSYDTGCNKSNPINVTSNTSIIFTGISSSKTSTISKGIGSTTTASYIKPPVFLNTIWQGKKAIERLVTGWGSLSLTRVSITNGLYVKGTTVNSLTQLTGTFQGKVTSISALNPTRIGSAEFYYNQSTNILYFRISGTSIFSVDYTLTNVIEYDRNIITLEKPVATRVESIYNDKLNITNNNNQTVQVYQVFDPVCEPGEEEYIGDLVANSSSIFSVQSFEYAGYLFFKDPNGVNNDSQLILYPSTTQSDFTDFTPTLIYQNNEFYMPLSEYEQLDSYRQNLGYRNGHLALGLVIKRHSRAGKAKCDFYNSKQKYGVSGFATAVDRIHLSQLGKRNAGNIFFTPSIEGNLVKLSGMGDVLNYLYPRQEAGQDKKSGQLYHYYYFGIQIAIRNTPSASTMGKVELYTQISENSVRIDESKAKLYGTGYKF